MSDETKLAIIREYMYTGIFQTKLMAKYNFRGNGNLHHWLIKFGLWDECQGQKRGTSMKKMKLGSVDVKELEARIRVLERELERERLHSLALDMMIDVAEHELMIEI